MEHVWELERGNDSPGSNANAAARSGYPTKVIKAATKLGNEVCGLSRSKR